jgi:hypothetical protein
MNVVEDPKKHKGQATGKMLREVLDDLELFSDPKYKARGGDAKSMLMIGKGEKKLLVPGVS